MRADRRKRLGQSAQAIRKRLRILESTHRKAGNTARRLAMLAHAVEQSPSIVLITDRAGHIEYVNPRFTALTGYPLDEIAGKTPRILKSGTVAAETYRRMWNTILSGEEWHSEILNKKRDGTLYWQRSAVSPIRNGFGVITHFLEVAEEITREKELESQLFQSQKMEAIGQLAGGVAHDFNNMLTVIIGVAELMKGRLDSESELYSYAQSILSAAYKSSSLTHQLLIFSRREVLHPELLDFNGVVGDMEKMLRRLVGDNVRLATRLGNEVGSVLVDHSQLHQVVLNLVINAAQAIGGTGHILVSTEKVDIAREEIDLPEHLAPGEYVRLRVRDDGCGMDRETLRHVFEPFYTTKRNGTGLGLSTVYGIVHQSYGHIHVQTEPGKGAMFSVYFPSVSAQSADVASSDERGVDLHGKERILVAEDDDTVRATVNEILVENGYHVVLAASAEHAIAFCETDTEGVDLLITDVVLPRIDGVHLFHKLREITGTLNVLYVSGYAENLHALQSEIDEGRQFLEKPFGARQLLKAVRLALSKDASNPARS